jgi:hypothetical protein
MLLEKIDSPPPRSRKMPLEIVIRNLDTILLAVLIPFLLMVLFTLIRKGFGNSLTAMPDVFVCIASIDFYFALAPEIWKPMVHPSIKDSFAFLSFSFALVAAIFFLYTLTVEKKLVNSWIKQQFSPGFLLPSQISVSHFPYGGIFVSWILVTILIALNSLQFLAKG